MLTAKVHHAAPSRLSSSPRISDLDGNGGYSQLGQHAGRSSQLDSSRPPGSWGNVSLAGAKLIGGMRHMNQSNLSVEKGSVYGAVVLMPQLARSLGWPSTLTSLSISAYIYTFFCITLHACLIVYISKEEVVMDGTSGEMYLCDFGINMESCQGDCMGPGGTTMTPLRLYDWEQWVTRVYFRDSLKMLFPDMLEQIHSVVDPGEYGGESWWARILCCHLFVMNIFGELELIFNMLKLILFVPTRNESWILLDDAAEHTDSEEHWTEEVRILVAGMSIQWKAINFMFVFLPKLTLWWFTAVAGVNFLMETSSIDGIIVNSVAMGFLLSLDDLITTTLMSIQANWLLEKCEDFKIDPEGEELGETDQMEKHFNKEQAQVGIVVLDLFRKRLAKLFLAIVATYVFVWHYYDTHCQLRDGRYVSKSVYMPKSTSYTALNVLLPSFFPVDREEEPYWTYPR